MLNENDPCYLIAEIGINHNGDIDIAKNLIYQAKEAGFDCVKFQKRTIDVVYTEEELAKPREHPFGKTNGDLKRHLEFTHSEYKIIDEYCSKLGIAWTASPWDEDSVDFLMDFDIPFIKVASASATDKMLLSHIASTGLPMWVSTGGMSAEQIDKTVRHIRASHGDLKMLFHCNSTYPCPVDKINLRGILALNTLFPDVPIGYSGHETGAYPSVMAAVMGACAVERHITLNRAMFGSDQAASLEVDGMRRLVKGIRAWEQARGDGHIAVTPEELDIMKKLRRKDTIKG